MAAKDDDDEIIIICTRCEDTGSAGITEDIRPCAGCGKDVWVTLSIVDEAKRMLPGRPVELRCERCQPREPGVVHSVPSQVAALRAAGMPDDQIVHMLALGEASGGSVPMAAAAEEIAAFPRGERARVYVQALRRNRLMVERSRSLWN